MTCAWYRTATSHAGTSARTIKDAPGLGLHGVDLGPGLGHDGVEACVGKLGPQCGKVVVPDEGRSERTCAGHPGRHHEFEIADILFGRTVHDFSQHRTGLSVPGGVEGAKGHEELVVPRSVIDFVVANRQGIDQPVTCEVRPGLAGQHVFQRHSAEQGPTGWRPECERGLIDAKTSGACPVQIVLGVDGPAQMVVQIAALRHGAQERGQLCRALFEGFKTRHHLRVGAEPCIAAEQSCGKIIQNRPGIKLTLG